MHLNLSQFKKISDDKNSSVLRHPDGHTISVSKKSLNPKMLNELNALPMHFADGGEEKKTDFAHVFNEPYDPSENKIQQRPQQPTIIINNGPTQPVPAGGIPNYDPNAPWKEAPYSLLEQMTFNNSSLADKANTLRAAQERMKSNEDRQLAYDQKQAQDAAIYNQLASQQGMPNVPVPKTQGLVAPSNLENSSLINNTPPPQVNSDPYGMAAYDKSMMDAINQQKVGLQNEANALSDQAVNQYPIYQNQTNQLQDLASTAKQKLDYLDNEYYSFIKDHQKDVDPQRYFHNMSTGQKIRTFIGLLLGGIGAGAARGPNIVSDYLDRQIDNDIKAQQLDIGRKNSLLEANRAHFKNIVDALDMTKSMMLGITANQIQTEAIKSQSPIIQARAQQDIAKLNMQAYQLRQGIALRQSMLGSLNGSQNSVGDTDQTGRLINFLRMTNPEMAKNMEQRYVPSVGLGSVPVPDKIREELITRQSLDNAVSDLRKFALENEGTVLDRAKVNEGAAKAKLVQDMYRRANGQGVFREAEADFVKGIVDQDPTKFFNSWRTDPKYKALEEDNMNQLNGVKRNYGLPTPYKPPSAKPYIGKK